MAAELLLALWIGLGVAASSESVESPAPLTTTEASAVYEATDFSLEQVGARHLLVGMERDTFIHALVEHYASSPQTDGSALRQLSQRWDTVQSNWQAMSASERRSFVYDVISVTYGRPIAAELVTDDTFADPSELEHQEPRLIDASLAGH